ncbi:spore photoproduct lyase [Clostridium sp. DJ247]|uniref:spore photoproduct lyase n=1 Tax=Clostridium sp. DJ247 TaxID=2726188 RepID=UPI0016251F78|nr:spore photoproduct lyase [Clostridium sp. DJ247]MBC2582073.1 spore photoproduct lyase [Clostridium sp. DJ247]
MFKPKRVVFEEEALEYDKGKELLQLFQGKDIEIMYSKNGRITGIPGKSPSEMYFEGKNTLAVGVRKALKFESCKPSAHYQLPLVSGCMGMCEYCYLNTQMGKKPYIKVYVNIDEILNKAEQYAKERIPDITIFEGAATSDPIPVENYTGALGRAIEYFSNRENTLFRFVTKFTDVDTLLGLKHKGRTTIRFSVNADEIISRFEHKTPSLDERLNAAKKVAEDGYDIGFIIAPVFLINDWKVKYGNIIDIIGKNFSGLNLKFEVISHRFTKRAKENILDIYPKTLLPMEEEIRKFKYGQFGYGKYLYNNEELKEMKDFFRENILKYFSEESINYLI